MEPKDEFKDESKVEYKDEFKQWLKTNLDEETKGISFSVEARAGVRRKISSFVQNSSSKHKFGWPGWLAEEISIPFKAVVSCALIAVLVIGLFYTRTFFYVSPQQLSELETREKIILREEGIPFGALQHLLASMDNSQGIGRAFRENSKGVGGK